MERCGACGADVPDRVGVCPACGATVRENTVSFPPVGGSALGESEAGGEGPLLVVRRGPEVGERFYLDGPKITIGRAPSSGIFLNDITVSRVHAVLEVSDGVVSVSDAGSLNGVYVNGVSVDKAELRNGDELQIGRFQMVFLSGGGE